MPIILDNFHHQFTSSWLLSFSVPEAPTAVKALVVGAQAILVSWRPPSHPNGIITQYTVYYREEGSESEPKSQKVPHYQMSYEAPGLDQNKPFEFWVTANTNIGEGQQSKSVVAMPSDKVPAKIASFDDTFTATFKEDAKLPCLAVGAPTPDIKWKIKGVDFVPNDRMRQLPEGSLVIKEVIRQDAGDYVCIAENSIARDSITHKLIVLGETWSIPMFRSMNNHYASAHQPRLNRRKSRLRELRPIR